MKRYPDMNANHKMFARTDNRFRRYIGSTAQLDLPLDEDVIVAAQQDYEALLHKYKEETEPSKMLLELRAFEKTASVPVSATAFASRHRAGNLAFQIQWDNPALDSQMRSEVAKIIDHVRKLGKEKRAVQQVRVGGHSEVLVYVNYADGDEKVVSVFGENLPRLRQLKMKYDPGCVFNKWYCIPPADASTEAL